MTTGETLAAAPGTGGRQPPVVPAEPGGAAEVAATVRDAVATHGCALVRGLELREPADVGIAARALLASTTTEFEGFAPRDTLGPGLYSATHWPADQPLCMHHELSYLRRVPGTLVFGLLTAAESGGDIEIAAADDVFDALPPDISEPFSEHGWILRRNYHPLLGTPWQDAFRTADRGAVERYCASQMIELEWYGDGSLHTTQRRPAVVDAAGGRRRWFNQVAFLNEQTMEPAVCEYLVAELGAERGLPFTTLRGDGTPLTARDVERINDAYAAHAVATSWQAGDLLVVDNLRIAHSRTPYRGERRVAVVLGDLTLPPAAV